MTTEIIEIDEFAIPEAEISHTVAYQCAEPDVGIFSGYHEVTSRIETWSIGRLVLSRAALVKAIGEDAVATIEDRAAEAHARLLDAGDGIHSDARFDTLQEAQS